MKNLHAKTSQSLSSIEGLRLQKVETLRMLHAERETMDYLSRQILAPYREARKQMADTPPHSISRTIRGAQYAYRILKDVYSIFKVLR